MHRILVLAPIMFLGATAAVAEPATEWPATASQPVAQETSPAPAPMVYRARDGEIIDSVGSDAIPALPLTVMSNGTMKYVTGGIGDEELAQLKSMENDFNVQMLIAGMHGSFIGDVTVRVIDTKDTVLFTVDNAGPYFYVHLPAGDYVFEVTTPGGNMKSLKIVAPATVAIKPVVRFNE